MELSFVLSFLLRNILIVTQKSVYFKDYCGWIYIVINLIQFCTATWLCVAVPIAVYFFLEVSFLSIVMILLVKCNPTTCGIINIFLSAILNVVFAYLTDKFGVRRASAGTTTRTNLLMWTALCAMCSCCCMDYCPCQREARSLSLSVGWLSVERQHPQIHY